MNPGRWARDPLNIISLLFGLGWLLFALLARPIGDYGVETDFYGDLKWARQWYADGPTLMNGFRGPLYHLVLGGLAYLIRDGFLAGKLISVVSATIGLRVLGGLVRGLFGPLAGLGAVLFVAAAPRYIEHTFRACTDQFFWLLFVTTLTLLFRETNRPVRAWGLAGVAAGAAWLTRYNGLMLVPIAAIAAAFTLRPLSRAGRAGLAFGAAALVTASPWLIFVGQETGNPLWNNTYKVLASSIYGPSPGLAQQGELAGTVGFASLFEVLRVDPQRVLAVLPAQAWDHLRGDVTQLAGIPMALVALLGVLAGLRSHAWFRPRSLAFWLCGTVVFAGMLPVFYNPRFMLPLLIWWGAAAGGLFQSAAVRVRSQPHSVPKTAPTHKKKAETPKPKPRRVWSILSVRARVVVSLFVVLTGWSSFQAARESLDPTHPSSPPSELVDLARVARRDGLPIGPTTPIAARKPHIGYCLDAPVIPIPMGGPNELRAAGAHYLFVSAIEAHSFPLLAPLLQLTDPAQSPPGLRLLAGVMKVVEGGRGSGGKLYAVENPLLWVPPEEKSPVVVPDTEPGLNRLDTLRLRLARWYLLWSPDPSVESLVRLMTPTARRDPRVLVLEGDAALLEGDPATAVGSYRQALAADPESPATYLRLAGARMLSEPGSSARDLLNHPAAGLEVFLEDSTASWWTVAAPHITGGAYAAALAPLMACTEAAPGNADCHLYLGLSLMSLGWHERAAAAFRRCLELTPDDMTAQNALHTLEARLARDARRP